MIRPLVRRATCVAVLTAALCVSGCQMFSFLHPSNTWTLNRGPARDTGDVYFSVSDPEANQQTSPAG
jgi:hypothetical protein